MWNQQNNATTGALGGAYPWKSGQDALVAAVATGGLRDDRYWRALCEYVVLHPWTSANYYEVWRQSRSKACIDSAYSQTFTTSNGTAVKLDALLVPNVGGGGASSSMSSVVDAAQYPAITIPVDVDGFNVPIGLGIWGTAYSEDRLVKWASAMESVFQFNRDFEPGYDGYNTTKIPFDARWVSSKLDPVFVI